MRKFKKICLIIAVVLSSLLTGCGNRDLLDTTYTYDKAIIELPDGAVVEGKVESWRDYEDGDQIQVKINGKTYLAHSSNIVLISGESKVK